MSIIDSWHSLRDALQMLNKTFHQPFRSAEARKMLNMFCSFLRFMIFDSILEKCHHSGDLTSP